MYHTAHKTKMTHAKVKPSIEHLRVMGIGGSIAEGDGATNKYGYLQMTFDHFHDTYFNKAIYGANGTQLGTMYKADYPSWLRQINPQVVVISWGLLNDVVPDVSISQFNSYIQSEIQQALAKKAIVMIVTPPVTEFAYGSYGTKENEYDLEEVHYVKSLEDTNVYVFDLFTQMKAYIQHHNLNIKALSYDEHHPNNQGYQVASNLLVNDISKVFR